MHCPKAMGWGIWRAISMVHVRVCSVCTYWSLVCLYTQWRSGPGHARASILNWQSLIVD